MNSYNFLSLCLSIDYALNRSTTLDNPAEHKIICILFQNSWSSLQLIGADDETIVLRQAIVTNNSTGATEELPGSQSFNWSIPLVNLPGRAGLDVSLSLIYNSRMWDFNTVDNDITFNIDRDFPSYGFRLDYGYLE